MYTRDMKRMRQTTGSTPLQTPWQVSHRVKVNNRKTFLFMHSFAPISLLQVNLFLRSIPREKKRSRMATFLFLLQFTRTTSRVLLYLIKLDVVGREQAGLAAEVAEPPVVVGEFLLEMSQYWNGDGLRRGD